MQGVPGPHQLFNHPVHGIVTVQVAGQAAGAFKEPAQCGLQVLRIDFFHQVFHGRIRDFGGHGILLGIGIISDRRRGILNRLLKMVHFVGKAVLEDDGGIILAGTDALKCFLRIIQDFPADVGAFLQFFHDLFRTVDAASVFRFDSPVTRSHSHRDLSGVDIRVCVGINIHPGIQCGEDADGKDDQYHEKIPDNRF